MRAFENLFLKLRVDNITNRGKQFDIFLLLYNETGSNPKLSIEVAIYEPNGYDGRAYRIGDTHQFSVLATINLE